MLGGQAWGFGQVGVFMWTMKGHTNTPTHTCHPCTLSLCLFSFKTNNIQIHPPTASFTPLFVH
jgi:hypothetical protein